jgi:hypothetical protein
VQFRRTKQPKAKLRDFLFKKEDAMDVSRTDPIERVARVLAGLKLSWNGHGEMRSAGDEVDRTWRDHAGDARAVLNALREPDGRMVEVGDCETWTRMVRAALGEDIVALKDERRSFAEAEETYQKPWG